MSRLGPLLAALLFIGAFAGCVEKVERGADRALDRVTGGDRSRSPSADDALPDDPAPEPRERVWASLEDATIRPGVRVTSDAGQCTSNFVYTDPANETVYLGFAAHCVAGGDPTDTNGCDEAVAPFEVGAEVRVAGATQPARLAYTSWGAMQAAEESDRAACEGNDFAVVELHPDDAALVNPAVQRFGGPTALAGEPPAAYDRLLSYGSSSARPGATASAFSPREGYAVATESGGWTHVAYFFTPAIPGDSGSGVMLGGGEALGVLVTLGAGHNGLADLGKALAYARDHGGPDLRLATWEQLDAGSLPPLEP